MLTLKPSTMPHAQAQLDAKFVMKNHLLQVPYKRYFDKEKQKTYERVFVAWCKYLMKEGV